VQLGQEGKKCQKLKTPTKFKDCLLAQPSNRSSHKQRTLRTLRGFLREQCSSQYNQPGNNHRRPQPRTLRIRRPVILFLVESEEELGSPSNRVLLLPFVGLFPSRRM